MKELYKNSKEEQLIENLKTIEVTPPVGLWNDIDATLKAKTNHKIFTITSWVSAASIALLISIGGYYHMQSTIELAPSNDQVSQIPSTPIIKSEVTKDLKNSISTSRTEVRNAKLIEPIRQTFRSLQTSQSPISLEEIQQNVILPRMLKSIQSQVKRSADNYPEKIVIKAEIPENYFGNAIAQLDSGEKRVKGEWFFAAAGFPAYSFHTAGTTNNSWNQNEVGIVSWGGSFSARYAISRKISIETGLIYNTLGQQEKNIYIVTTDASNSEVRSYGGLTNSYGVLTVSNADITVMGKEVVYDLSTAAINASSFNKVDALQRFRYLEIPISIARGIYVKGIMLNFKGGLSAGFLIGNRLDLRGSNFSMQGMTKGVDPFVLSALASIGFSVPITKSVRLLVEPTYKLGLNSLSTASGKSYPFSTFIKFGIEVPI